MSKRSSKSTLEGGGAGAGAGSAGAGVQSTTAVDRNSPTMPLDPGRVGREFVFKVIVVGDLATGKTALIKRYVHDVFTTNYRATIGVDFAIKLIQMSNNTVVRLQLWDIAGQERFGNMTRVFYRDAVAAIVVYDVTRPVTFEAVQKWKRDIDEKVRLDKSNAPIPCVLLANKCDLEDMVGKSDEEMDSFCKEFGFAGWFRTSARMNTNVTKAIYFLVSQIMETLQVVGEDSLAPAGTDPNIVTVDGTSHSAEGAGEGGANAGAAASGARSKCC